MRNSFTHIIMYLCYPYFFGRNSLIWENRNLKLTSNIVCYFKFSFGQSKVCIMYVYAVVHNWQLAANESANYQSRNKMEI